MLEYWGAGRFAFARIQSKGVHIGYGVTCALHVNSDGYAAGTPCKKALTGQEVLALGENECKLRLKRWLVAGLKHTLDPARERQSHVNLGGRHLIVFASNSHWGSFEHADLDALLGE